MAEKYLSYHDEFLTILVELASIRNIRPRRTSSVKHRIVLKLPSVHPLQLVQFRAETNAHDLKKKTTEYMYAINKNATAQVEWASPVVISLKKDKTLRFRFENRLINTLDIMD